MTLGDAAAPSGWAGPVVRCVDVGSTFTKAAAVGLPDGVLLATASAAHDGRHRRDGRDPRGPGRPGRPGRVAAPGGADDDVLACSSAGGGLRLAVVGYERAVTAEAGYRVGLSAGAKVVHVASGRLDPTALDRLRADAPDVVLLVGGTDGGNSEVLLHNAAPRWRRAVRAVPVVLAGNADAQRRGARRAHGAGQRRSGDADRDGQRAADDRRAGPVARAPGDPRGVHPARHRRQAPVRVAAVRGDGARGDAGRGARRRRAARRVGRRRGGRRRGRCDDRRVLGADPRPGGGGAAPRGGRAAVAQPYGRGRPRACAGTRRGSSQRRWPSGCSTRPRRRPWRGEARQRAADPGWLPDRRRRGGNGRAAGRARGHRGAAPARPAAAVRRGADAGKDLRQVRMVVGSGGVLRHGGPEVVQYGPAPRAQRPRRRVAGARARAHGRRPQVRPGGGRAAGRGAPARRRPARRRQRSPGAPAGGRAPQS